MDLFAGELGGNGVGEKAGAAGGNRDRESVAGGVAEEDFLSGAAGVDEGEKLPVVDVFAFGFEFGADGVGEGEIHVVAAEEEMVADADAVELEVAAGFADGDEAEVDGAAADVANEDDLAGFYLFAPGFAGGGEPGVESGERFFEESWIGETGGDGGFVGEGAGGFVEGGGNGDDGFAIVEGREVFAGVEEAFAEVFEVAAGGFEGGDFALGEIGFPRENRAFAVGVGLAEPAFGGGDEAVGDERAVVAGEDSGETEGFGGLPRELEGAGGEFVGVRQVEGRREGIAFADVSGGENLGDGNDADAVGRGERHDGVGRSEIDAEAVGLAHDALTSTSAGTMTEEVLAAGSGSTMRGRSILEAFQPLWRRVPWKGGEPASLPTARNSRGLYPDSRVTELPSSASLTGTTAKWSLTTLEQPWWTTRAAPPICSLE